MPTASAHVVTRTDRLVIRPWRLDEAERMFDLYRRDDVVRFLGTEPRPLPSVEEAAGRIARIDAWNREHEGLGFWAVQRVDTGEVVGTVGLEPLGEDESTEDGVEVYWHLHPDSQGHGFATEAARAVLELAHRGGHAEVLALVDPENTPSLGVARRLGLEHQGRSQRWFGKELEVFVSRPAAP